MQLPDVNQQLPQNKKSSLRKQAEGKPKHTLSF
jgi:hypothetical protein